MVPVPRASAKCDLACQQTAGQMRARSVSFRSVRPGAMKEVWKVFCYLAASLVLAALLTPWIYNAGKAIAEVSQGKQTNDAIAWFAAACGRARYGRYFDRALMISALLLAVPLVKWLRAGRGALRFRDTPWSLRWPDDEVELGAGQPLRANPRAGRHFGIGVLLGAVLLLGFGAVLVYGGAFELRPSIKWGKWLFSAACSALAVAAIEEMLFRGWLLGIFLRALKPWPAMLMLTALFVMVHFLEPAPRAVVVDPEGAWSGFRWLADIVAHLGDFSYLLDDVATLFIAGMVLAYARWRTASLWLPFGLHCGWVFGVTLFKQSTVVAKPMPLFWDHWIGDTLREGLAPLLILLMTGMLVHWVTCRDERAAS